MRLSPLLLTSFALLTSLSACTDAPVTDKGSDTVGSTDDSSVTDDSAPPSWVDEDEDGVSPADGDCDDGNVEVYPGRAEECNGLDDNCNDVIDESFGDVDDDGTADCIDAETCDGADNDGDGVADEDFADNDSDGVADCVGTEACDGMDNDGDGQIDEGYDADGDGYTQCGTKSGGGTDDAYVDCDDSDAAINPGASEASGDGVDNNCDGAIDDGLWSAGDLVISEIMNNPTAVSDSYGEWFEVYNASDRDITLNGIKIVSGSDSHVVDPGDEVLTVPAGERFVFGVSDEVGKNGGVDVGYDYDGITLGNESDDLSIVVGSVTVDEVAWDNGSSFPDPEGATMTLDPGFVTATYNDSGTYWCEATERWSTTSDDGSPGAENELCTTFDHDGDGFSDATGDCDDWDDTVYPGAPEIDADKDNDCDGEVELMPVADAAESPSNSDYTCDKNYLDASRSYDPDGTSVTYSWELTSAPAGSELTTADIINSTDQKPYFQGDVAGDYTFTLTVNDGGTDSYPVSLTVTLTTRPTNTLPSSNAGSDASYADTAACQAISYGVYYSCAACDGTTFTLNGTGSSDADGDEYTYLWAVTSGSSYTLADETTATPTVTVSGVTPEYGATETVTIEVQLTVTDCMGGTDDDSVTLTYTCTGT